jgi:hypothetical protein
MAPGPIFRACYPHTLTEIGQTGARRLIPYYGCQDGLKSSTFDQS